LPGGRNEIPTSSISASGGECCRATGRFTDCKCANLSDAAGRIVVGYAADGSADIVARLIGQSLSQRLGQQFIVENRLGAATNIATEAVVRAPPDGYTLLLVTPASAINATLYEKLNYNFIRDIAPVASIEREPSVMVINPSVSARTVPELSPTQKPIRVK
jgi:tripartite-type tricarboxylate transporter receptor subunit TctC